ncbi:MAG: 2-oxoacid:ferredoxin oxidoreductase subunit beta [Ignavibacteriota bacterium]
MSEKTEVKYTAKDYSTGIDVRWCPGCGDFSILAQVQRSFPQLVGVEKEKIVFISGIGCSSRFPYYMNTYGFHTIHGRAAAIASGVKTANPDLSVWMATGDGDCLSIGGNHFVHLLRRNIDINVLLFNNRIYGLTKGQNSPTSEHGKITKSTPLGNIEYPVNPIAMAIGVEGTFIARAMDVDTKHLQALIQRAHQHKGTSFIEILQNCVIFNDGAFDNYTLKAHREDRVVYLEHGQPMVFGKEKDKAIKLDGFTPVLIDLKDGKHSVNDALVYNEKSKELAYIISQFSDNSAMPLPVGVFVDLDYSTFEDDMTNQIAEAKKKYGEGDINSLLRGKSSWEIN